MYRSILFIGLLMSVGFAFHLNLETETIHKNKHSHQHHLEEKGTPEKVESDKVKSPQAAHPELEDEQLVISAILGGQKTKLVLDMTSQITWVQSRDPRHSEAKTVGAPADTKPYECTNACTVDKDQTEPQSGSSFGKRLDYEYFFGTLKEAQIDKLVIKDVKIGLVSKVTGETKELQANHGVLGLSFGKEQRDYYEKRSAQVDQGPVNHKLEESLNFVHQLSKQHPTLVPEPVVAIKLEDHLQIVTFGKADEFFVEPKEQLKEFTNQGTNGWELKLSEFAYGPFDDEPKATLPSAQAGTLDSSLKAVGKSEASQLNKGYKGEKPTGKSQASALNKGYAGQVGHEEGQQLNNGYGGNPEAGQAGEVGNGYGGRGHLESHFANSDVSYASQFDLSTKFILAPQQFITPLLKDLKKEGKTCQNPAAGELINCACEKDSDIDNFSKLSFRFNHQKNIFRISPRNYIKFINGKCYIGIKSNTAPASHSHLDANLEMVQRRASPSTLTVGKPFFKENYVALNQRKNALSIAKAHKVNPGRLGIKRGHRTGFIIAGILLFLAALAALLTILKQIKYVPEEIIQAPRAVSLQPSRIVYAQQQPVYVIPQAQSFQAPVYSAQQGFPSSYGAPQVSNRSRYVPGAPTGYVR